MDCEWVNCLVQLICHENIGLLYLLHSVRWSPKYVVGLRFLVWLVFYFATMLGASSCVREQSTHDYEHWYGCMEVCAGPLRLFALLARCDELRVCHFLPTI